MRHAIFSAMLVVSAFPALRTIIEGSGIHVSGAPYLASCFQRTRIKRALHAVSL